MNNLTQILAGNSQNIADEWRKKWNRDVLPYLRANQLVAGRGIRIDRRPNGTVVGVDSSDRAGNAGVGHDVTLAVVTTAPAGGYGVCECQGVTMNQDGTYQITSGATIPAVIPYI